MGISKSLESFTSYTCPGVKCPVHQSRGVKHTLGHPVSLTPCSISPHHALSAATEHPAPQPGSQGGSNKHQCYPRAEEGGGGLELDIILSSCKARDCTKAQSPAIQLCHPPHHRAIASGRLKLKLLQKGRGCSVNWDKSPLQHPSYRARSTDLEHLERQRRWAGK